MKAEDRLGLIKQNNKGTNMEIIKVLEDDKIIVRFNDSFRYEKEIHWNNFKKGTIKNPYDRTVYGVGYLGTGDYYCWEGNKPTIYYTIWENMLCRCYYEKNRYLNPAYKGCTVCEEWYNLQNFAKWYYDNFYPVEGRLHIDKDVMVKGNKIYSPETCVLLPQRINMIFMEKEKNRDSDLPNAIYRCVAGYQAAYNGKSLGVYKTLDEAIDAHNTKMRINIKQVAEEYKNIIPDKAYQALLKW